MLPGLVYLVGAGPGDPELLTLRAAKLLAEAEVIVHDHLVSAPILEMGHSGAQRIYAGKERGNHTLSQTDLNQLLVRLAREGKRVIRLKGGDPFIFGRGGEEVEALAAAGIAFEVVPGITAACGVAAYAGIPLTHRDHAQSVRLLTAHCKASHDTLDWPALARERQTLAVYMGVAQLAAFQQRLIAHGRAASTPFALVENGSRPEQRVITGSLGQLAQRACDHAVQSPALLILGEVAALAESLAWFGATPVGALVETLPRAAPPRAADALLSAIHRG